MYNAGFYFMYITIKEFFVATHYKYNSGKPLCLDIFLVKPRIFFFFLTLAFVFIKLS